MQIFEQRFGIDFADRFACGVTLDRNIRAQIDRLRAPRDADRQNRRNRQQGDRPNADRNQFHAILLCRMLFHTSLILL